MKKNCLHSISSFQIIFFINLLFLIQDEGSALFITEADGQASVVGVFSYGYAEGNCPGARTLFTRVSAYADWINEEISGGGMSTEDPVSTVATLSEEDFDLEVQKNCMMSVTNLTYECIISIKNKICIFSSIIAL